MIEHTELKRLTDFRILNGQPESEDVVLHLTAQDEFLCVVDRRFLAKIAASCAAHGKAD